MKYRNVLGWGAYIFGILSPFSIFLLAPEQSGFCEPFSFPCQREVMEFGHYFLLATLGPAAILLLCYVFTNNKRRKLMWFSAVFLPVVISMIASSSPGFYLPGTGEILGWPLLVSYFAYLISISLKELTGNVFWMRRIEPWKIIVLLVALTTIVFLIVINWL